MRVDIFFKIHRTASYLPVCQENHFYFRLCLKACFVKLSCHHASYKKLLKELRKQLECKQDCLVSLSDEKVCYMHLYFVANFSFGDRYFSSPSLCHYFGYEFSTDLFVITLDLKFVDKSWSVKVSTRGKLVCLWKCYIWLYPCIPNADATLMP